MAIKLVLGMAVALVLNQQIRGRNFFRAFLLLPWVMPAFVVYLVWRWLYDPLSGLINYALIDMGLIASPIAFLSNRDTAMASVIVAHAWRNFPFYAISFLAGMQTISQELYDSAQVDGASRVQQFRFITLPGLYQIIGVVLLLTTIQTANAFEPVYLLTGGGPSDATMVYTMLVYAMGMVNLRLGEAAAVSTLFLPLLVGLVLVVTDDAATQGQRLRERNTMREPLGIRATTYVLLALFVIMVAVPLFWMVTTALKANKDLYEDFTYLPRRPTLEHFVRVIQRDDLLTNIRNSFAVASTTTVVTVVVSAFAAFSIVRYRYRGREWVGRLILFKYLLPTAMLFVPLYAIVVAMGLGNTLKSLMLTYLSFTVPFCTWMLMGYFRASRPSWKSTRWSTAAARSARCSAFSSRCPRRASSRPRSSRSRCPGTSSSSRWSSPRTRPR